MTKSENAVTADAGLEPIRQAQQRGEIEEAVKEWERLPDVLRESAHGRMLHAILLFIGDDKEKAGQVAAGVEEQVPGDAAWAADLGLWHLFRGEMESARKVLEGAVAKKDADAAAWNRLGSARLVAGDVEGAIDALQESLLRNPQHPALHSNLGGLLLRSEKPREALDAYEHALRLQPELTQALEGKQAALLTLGRAAELIEETEARLLAEPTAVELRMRLARLLLADERREEAAEQLRRVREESEGDQRKEASVQLAGLLLRLQRYGRAVQLLQKASDEYPDEVRFLSLLAIAYSEAGRRPAAEKVIVQLESLAPDSVAFFKTRAHVASDSGDYEQAEADLRRVVEIHPGSAESWTQLGHTLLWRGAVDEAVSAFQEAAKLNPSALAALVEARAIPSDPQVIEEMERFVRLPLVPAEAKSAMAFALIKVFEKQRDYPKTFEYADTANGLVRKRIRHDSDAYAKRVDRICDVFSQDLFSRLWHVGVDSSRPIFVVGMPRSGTTLTEQVLASHGQVFGAGELGLMPRITKTLGRILKSGEAYPEVVRELTPEAAEKAANAYLRQLKEIDGNARFVVDKLPHNFMNLGLIALLFPNAKVINVMREPRDVAISNYFTNFKMAHHGLSYAFDLEEIGRMLNDYQRIMAHWHRVLPLPIFDLQYEQLVADPEGTTRSLCEFLGLDWQPELLEFHQSDRAVRTASVWQVRQPMYKSSTARWKRYQDFLGPLEAVLASEPH